VGSSDFLVREGWQPVTAKGLCAKREPVKNPGVCVALSYHLYNLATRQNEREG